MKSKILIIGVLIMSLLSCIFQSKEQKFWSWFSDNSNQLLLIKQGNEPIADALVNQLKQVNEKLTFEVSADLINGKKEFTISADGNKFAFDAVTKLFDAQPQLDKWDVKKFRQRKIGNTFNLKYEDIVYDAKDTKYILINDENPNKVGIVLFNKNYTENLDQKYRGVALLFLDAILGEYDMETKVGTIGVYGFDSEYYTKAKDIKELPENIDEIFQK